MSLTLIHLTYKLVLASNTNNLKRIIQMENKPTTQVFAYNNNPISFQIGSFETMISATQMCKSFNRRPNDYLVLQSTIELVRAITRKTGISEYQLVTKRRGSTENGGGTWMHETIALDFAQWLSVDFKLWCIDRTKELLRFGITATEEMLIKAATDPGFVLAMMKQIKDGYKLTTELTERNKQLEQEAEQNASKVEFYDKLQSINDNEHAKKVYPVSQIARELKISATALNKLLLKKGLISKINGSRYIADKYKDCGYTVARKTLTNGRNEDDEQVQVEVHYVAWTQKGRAFILSLIE